MSDSAPAPSGRQRQQRRPTVGDGQAPITTVIVLCAAATAVIAGFVILQSIGDPAGGSGGRGQRRGDVDRHDAVGDERAYRQIRRRSRRPPRQRTVAPSVSKSNATVVVANASGVDRSATAMTAELAAAGYATTAVANATGPRLETLPSSTTSRGDPAALGVARLLAQQIPTAQTLPMPQPPPLDRPLNGSHGGLDPRQGRRRASTWRATNRLRRVAATPDSAPR